MKKNKKLLLIVAVIAALAIIGCVLWMTLGRQPEKPQLGIVPQPSLLDEAYEAGRRVEWNTTVKMENGTGVEEVDQVIGDLLDALTITAWSQKENSLDGFKVSLDGKAVLSAEGAVKDGTLYLTSDLLANNLLALSVDEIPALAERFAQLMGDESAAEAVSQALSAVLDPSSIQVSMENLEETVQNVNAFAEKIKPVIDRVAATAQDGDLTAKPENSDPAVKAKMVTVTAEDIVDVYGALFDVMRSNQGYMEYMDALLVTAEAGGTFSEQLDEMLGMLKNMLPEMMPEGAPVTYYFNKQDEVVAGTGKLTMTDGEETLNFDLVYTRLSGEESEKHTFTMAIDELGSVEFWYTALLDACQIGMRLPGDEGQVIAITADLAVAREENTSRTEGKVSIADETAQEVFVTLNLASDAVKEGDDVTETTVLTVAQGENTLGAMTVVAQTGDPKEFQEEGAIHPAQLSDEELETFAGDLMNNFQVWAMQLIFSLPSSALMLFMN